jgi:dihydrofolate reductase
MISLIAAMTPKRVIGKDNRLLWHIPDDWKNFVKLTTGNVVIMGRKTYESIGKPLKNRHNIVITRSTESLPGVETAGSVEEALRKARMHRKPIFIIGGQQIYEQFLPLADTMHLSFVRQEHEGDAFFPKFDEREWVVVDKVDYPDFEFCVYKRKKR